LFARINVAVATDQLVGGRTQDAFPEKPDRAAAKLILDLCWRDGGGRTLHPVAEKVAGRRPARPAARRLRWQDTLRGLDAEQARGYADLTARLEAELIPQVGDVERRLQRVLDPVTLQVVERRLVDLRPGSPRRSDHDARCAQQHCRVQQTVCSASHG
jgi:hypothetical protein